ncbi:SH3 domain-containing protein [Ewingella americana]|uniref:SH3 domain-containing protein n=1 Tax=Ewingella americana TaxID=41202 RepID=UPI001639F4CC|nr:SH3 domain-containing protein [Ewingella americana]QMV52838.1 SH3 domain-containing protein [Ewingella americana]
MVKIQIALSLLLVALVSGCKAPPPPPVTDDTVVSSTVDGVTLTYRHAVTPPTTFTPVNAEYRALYNASVMTTPDFSGKLVRQLVNGQTFTVLGAVENNWLAVAETGQEQMLGYVPLRAGVKSELYEQTLKADARRVRRAAPAKKTCVSVNGDGQACRNSSSGTWIIN